MGCLEGELSITLTDDQGIAELAGRFGRPPRPTDVLAFATREGEGAQYAGACLGDVVISIDRAAAQARESARPLQGELVDLLVHGVLHLLGMDHHRPAHARAMRELEDHLRWELKRFDG